LTKTEMKPFFNLLLIVALLLLIEGCNTLYNSQMIPIEVFKPGKFVFPADYTNVAVRYNNSNVSFNPTFSKYFYIDEVLTDTTNIDSIAGEIYFQAFTYNLKQQQFFDSVMVLAPGNYSGDFFVDLNQPEGQDSLLIEKENPTNPEISLIGKLINKFPGERIPGSDTIIIYPKTGFYNEKQLQQIADSTQADLLISLDYFGSTDGTSYIPQLFQGQRYVLLQGIWNLYDLNLQKLEYSGNRIDTVSWDAEGENAEDILKVLPPRKDAILNASEISGTKFAELIIPHWTEDERLYYRSRQVDLAKAEQLIKEGKWLEAAKIWKANINNPNKNIAAKCMFNMGLACEMEGDVDAAIDWVVQSFQVFKQKNVINAENCQDYLRILATRKFDFKRIEFQLNPEASPLFKKE
jgi:hypothetical protein